MIPNRGKKEREIARQAYAGLLWSKQFYYYIQKEWINGDKGQIAPPTSRKNGRNKEWPHLFNRDVISMPDKWEYPWVSRLYSVLVVKSWLLGTVFTLTLIMLSRNFGRRHFEIFSQKIGFDIPC